MYHQVMSSDVFVNLFTGERGGDEVEGEGLSQGQVWDHKTTPPQTKIRNQMLHSTYPNKFSQEKSLLNELEE